MKQSNDRIRIILIDDQILYRAGLRLLLECNPDFEVVAEVGTADELVERLPQLKPDIVLFATCIFGSSSLDVITQLIEKSESAKVILVTGNPDYSEHLTAIEMGAVGIIQKDQPPDLLFKAIKKVHRGEVWIERTMMASFLNRVTNPRSRKEQDHEADKIRLLSPREKEVLSLIGNGYKNKDIASELSISETTVTHHLTSIFTKLGVSDRLELLVYSYKVGLVKTPMNVNIPSSLLLSPASKAQL
jgi:two-component system, NarL family, nitrate/nitrite response regulator NarL